MTSDRVDNRNLFNPSHLLQWSDCRYRIVPGLGILPEIHQPTLYISLNTMVKLEATQEKGQYTEQRRGILLTRPELDSAVLAYLVARGLTRSVKAFEGETKAKIAAAGVLEAAWIAGSSKA